MKLFCCSLLFLLFGVTSAGEPETVLCMTASIDGNGQPYDKIAAAPLDSTRQFILYLFTIDRQTPIGEEKLTFNVSRYDLNTGKFWPSARIPLDIKPDWIYCYHPVYFQKPGQYKIVVTNAENDTIGNTLYFDVWH